MVLLQLTDQPAIIQAIFEGAVNEVEQLANFTDSVNCIDSEKRTPLHAAAFKGDSQIVNILISYGARVNAKDSKWITPLHRAAAVNADSVVEILLNSQADVSARDRLWQTPLHIAAAHDAYSAVHKLLDHTPNANVTDRAGRTALHHAAYNGNAIVAELLISRGAIVNACDKKDCRPLHCAVQMGHLDTVEALLRYGQADVNAKDRNQYTPLHVAAATGMESITRLLINAGAEVNAQNSYGNTPLHVSCLNGHLTTCQELEAAGADLEAVNFRGQTPLHIAAASTHGVDCLTFLLAKGVDINRTSSDGRTPLHMTAIHGRFTRSKILIDKGALIDCPDKNGSTPLHIAGQYGHDILLNTLLSYGANPSGKGYEGRTPLHMCCLSGYMECCRKLVAQSGVNLNEKDCNGRSPTHCAAYKGSIECLDLLTSNGADFRLKDAFDRLPLHYAAAQGHFQCVFTLVGIGSPINDRDCEGCTPLHLAAAHDLNGRCVEYILSHRGDPNVRDNRGFTPLHYAIVGGNAFAVRVLLQVTEDTVFRKGENSPDITPLHLAAKLGNIDVLRCVLSKYSNDVNIQTSDGLTPLILVAREDHIQCALFLLRYNAKVNICDNINQMTPVHYSAKNGHFQCLALLLHNTEDSRVVNMLDRQQRTALMLAVSGKHAECVQTLIKFGADANLADIDNHTALFRAVVNGKISIVQLLLWNGNSSANTRDCNGKSVLHLAAACGDFSSLKLVLDHVTDEEILLRDNQDCTVLHWACYNGHPLALELILKRNVFLKLEGNVFSPVHCACIYGSEACLELLLQHFGDQIVHLKDSRQRTPLHVCALHGHAECARVLLNHGAQHQVFDDEGRTPLIAAAQYGHCTVVEYLLSFKVDKTSCDKCGNTALHWACLKNHQTTALAIVEHCQDDDLTLINIPNADQKTPLHLAAKNGLVTVTRELLKKGASVLAVDNEGLTPALSCAPTYHVAQCLALILQALPQALTKNHNQEDSVLLTLPKISHPFLETSNGTNITQTDITMVQDPDFFQVIKYFGIKSFVPAPSNRKKDKSDVKRTILHISDNCTEVYLKEPKVYKETQNIECEPLGKNLHKSSGDISIHSTELNRKYFANCYCKKCGSQQLPCVDCQIKSQLKKHIAYEISTPQLIDFLKGIFTKTNPRNQVRLFQLIKKLESKKFRNSDSEDLKMRKIKENVCEDFTSNSKEIDIQKDLHKEAYKKETNLKDDLIELNQNKEKEGNTNDYENQKITYMETCNDVLKENFALSSKNNKSNEQSDKLIENLEEHNLSEAIANMSEQLNNISTQTDTFVKKSTNSQTKLEICEKSENLIKLSNITDLLVDYCNKNLVNNDFEMKNINVVLENSEETRKLSQEINKAVNKNITVLNKTAEDNMNAKDTEGTVNNNNVANTEILDESNQPIQDKNIKNVSDEDMFYLKKKKSKSDLNCSIS